MTRINNDVLRITYEYLRQWHTPGSYRYTHGRNLPAVLRATRQRQLLGMSPQTIYGSR